MLIKDYEKDRLVCKVFSDRDSMGKYAATQIAEVMRKLLSCQKEINMIFAAAPSQNEVLSYLVKEEDIDWSRVIAFHMDEYIGLEKGSPKSFGHFLDNAIFNHVNMKAVYYIGTTGPSDELCNRYEQLLKDHSIDIVCLGIGENGHIAFNDPHVADFNDSKLIKVIDLGEDCRHQQVNDKTFDTYDEVPKYAVTLTIPTLTSAKHMFCTVPTIHKASAVYHTMTDEINESVPATIMRRHEHAVMFTDADSASVLMQKTK
jgi:glucosamine-6-phosphate deaminase